MAILTTENAVRRILTREDFLLLWLQSGFTKAYRRKCLHLLNKNELSVKIQEKILVQCGFGVAVEKQWDITTHPRVAPLKKRVPSSSWD